MSEDTTAARVQSLLTIQVLATYEAATKALGTTDLVLLLDEEERDLRALRRTEFVAEFDSFLDGIDATDARGLLDTVARPASATMDMLKGSFAFWLVVTFSDNTLACTSVAVAAQRLARGSEMPS